ncbi:conserved hypothetical protein [Ricinus communis]|uniref:Uncharacterized protein n=1 Tax=Ricinus communis TaxID=3988 RepID=B9TG66_RICCO|nr:conserved hypothetical protein [Ricinus communis]
MPVLRVHAKACPFPFALVPQPAISPESLIAVALVKSSAEAPGRMPRSSMPVAAAQRKAWATLLGLFELPATSPRLLMSTAPAPVPPSDPRSTAPLLLLHTYARKKGLPPMTAEPATWPALFRLMAPAGVPPSGSISTMLVPS